MSRIGLAGAIARTRRPRRNALLLGILVVVIVAAIAWLFVLSPRMAESGDLQTQAETVELANLTEQHRLADLMKMADDAPRAAERVQALLERMPREADLPALFDQITQAALAAGIPANGISTITQSVPVPLDTPGLPTSGPLAEALAAAQSANAKVAKMDLTVSVTGKPGQIIDFTRRLGRLDRTVLLSGLSVANPSGEPDGDHVGTVTGTTFILQSTLPDLIANVDEVLQSAGVAGLPERGDQPTQ